MKNRSTFLVTVTILAVVDIIVEARIMPLLYQRIPIPFQMTSKPIGNALFSVTSLQLILITSNILVLVAVLRKAGYKSDLVPSRIGDWLDLFALLLLGVSGLAMWFNPFFLSLFLAAGAYLVLSEMR